MGTAIVLAGGRGRRMGMDVPKQYCDLGGKPVLFYSLAAFQRCPWIEQIVLVCRPGDLAYCRAEIVERYSLTKVVHITEGGADRYDSVEAGLRFVRSAYVWVHDGARPFLTGDMLDRLQKKVLSCGAVIAAVPVKDTIKQVGASGAITADPDRAQLWQAQTPQVFSSDLLSCAFRTMRKAADEKERAQITDDAMLVKRYAGCDVQTVQGDYMNIKLTTPEDFLLAQAYLGKYCLTEAENIC